jgi:hypothetical protein
VVGNIPISAKRRYWEQRLWELLRPTPIHDLLVLSWSLDTFREGRVDAARKHVNFPGSPEEHQLPKRYFIPPWHIDAVINEKLRILDQGGPNGRRLNLAEWPGIAKLMNTYNGLSNSESTMDFSPNGIFAAMPRLFWPQYDWQIGFENNQRLGRAWYTYSAPEAKAAFQAKHGLDLDTFLKSMFAIYAMTADNPAADIVPIPEIGISARDMYHSCQIIGMTIKERHKHANEHYNKNIPRAFNRSSIKEFPVFMARDGQRWLAVVPSRPFLMLRITDGLYYDIVANDSAKNSAGGRFESLCLKLIQHHLDAACDIEGEKQTSYGLSADIQVRHEPSDCGLIIECKARRLPQRVLTSPDPWTDCSEDFDDVAKGIVQIWRSHCEITLPAAKRMAGVVLMYDPWTIMGGAFLKDLFRRAHEKADRIGIPNDGRIPVFLSSIFDFDRCLTLHNIQSIFEAVVASHGEQFAGYELYGVLSDLNAARDESERFDFDTVAREAMPWWGFGDREP